MQTFLPHPSFKKSAKDLDSKRLIKQKLECIQILRALERKRNGESGIAWGNHPAVLMWVGFEDALKAYTNAIIKECINRGVKNTTPLFDVGSYKNPPWLGDNNFHRSHQSNLVRKDDAHYWPLYKIDGDLEYVWPVRIGD